MLIGGGGGGGPADREGAYLPRRRPALSAVLDVIIRRPDRGDDGPMRRPVEKEKSFSRTIQVGRTVK